MWYRPNPSRPNWTQSDPRFVHPRGVFAPLSVPNVVVDGDIAPLRIAKRLATAAAHPSSFVQTGRPTATPCPTPQGRGEARWFSPAYILLSRTDRGKRGTAPSVFSSFSRPPPIQLSPSVSSPTFSPTFKIMRSPRIYGVPVLEYIRRFTNPRSYRRASPLLDPLHVQRLPLTTLRDFCLASSSREL